MTKTTAIQAVRGMNDILPNQSVYWSRLETTLKTIAKQYGYDEIRFPILEQTQLFCRSVGNHTDIVEKEMFTFEARNGDSLSLRPEGTAGCTRAGIEHGLLYNQIQRLWYLGPMFRHERPQRGRTRQFHQFGAEAFGMPGAAIEAELIAMNHALWQALGLDQHITLHINSLGSLQARADYKAALVAYLTENQSQLDEDSLRRLKTNPLRILDSKHPTVSALLANAPVLSCFLDDASQADFNALCDLLDGLGIAYQVDHRLVRGLDYYTGTVFEFMTTALGAQGTLSAGGRYNHLVADLGGKATPAAGFALGLERVIELLNENHAQVPLPDQPAVYIVTAASAIKQGMVIAQQLRCQYPDVVIITDCTQGSLKAQFKRADKSGANFAMVIDEEHAKSHIFLFKSLTNRDYPQTTHAQVDAVKVFAEAMNN